MTTPTSYLQTLAKDEAIAFVASLQKVKTHLSHELTWMSQQIQQKTVQLQGLETLLSEAAALKLVAATDSTVESTVTIPSAETTIAAASVTHENGSVGLSAAARSDSLAPAPNGDAAPTELTLTAVPPLPVKASTRGKRSSQPTKTKKTSAVPAPAKPTSTGTRQIARESTQPFVRSQFQDQSITDAIGNILQRSQTPLSADEIMAVLYEGLSDEAYKRAKNSVTNILSVGKGKEKWQSTGRGLYADNAVVSA